MAQTDRVIALGGDGTLLEPAVDGDADRLLHDLLHNSSRFNVQSSTSQIRTADFHGAQNSCKCKVVKNLKSGSGRSTFEP
jgi:hypothetical protein